MVSVIEGFTKNVSGKSIFEVACSELSTHTILTHKSAGWVICNSEFITIANNIAYQNGNEIGHIQETTFLCINGEFMTNGTGHEMFFTHQGDAIKHIMDNNLRNCWVVFKVS